MKNVFEVFFAILKSLGVQEPKEGKSKIYNQNINK